MNILFITSEFPYPPNSGGRIYTWQRIRYLSENNNIFLFSIIDDKDIEYLDCKEVKSVCKKVHTYKRKDKFIKALKGITLPFTVASRKIDDMINDISKLISRGDIDIVVIDNPQMIINCDMNNNIPKILTQHNIEYKAFESMYENANNILHKLMYRREYKLMKIFEKKYYLGKDIDAYTFISQDDKYYFETKYKSKSTMLLPPGIESYEAKEIKDNSYNIVFTGKMDYEPNIQAMKWFCEKIFPLIEKEVDNVKFYIVGKNPTEYINSLAKKNIIVTGIVDSVDEYLDMADIIVIPLLSGGGVKIKLIEAIQRNNIVVTTKKGVEGTEFKHNQDVLVTDNENKFADYCIDILNDKNKYEIFRKNSLKCLEKNYLWSTIGSKYEEFINKVINS